MKPTPHQIVHPELTHAQQLGGLGLREPAARDQTLERQHEFRSDAEVLGLHRGKPESRKKLPEPFVILIAIVPPDRGGAAGVAPGVGPAAPFFPFFRTFDRARHALSTAAWRRARTTG